MGLYKKGRNWFIDFYYPPGRDGARHREKVGPDKHEAEIVLAQRLRDIRQGLNPDLRTVRPKPFTEMVKEFTTRHVAHLRDQSGYGVSLRALARHLDGKTPQEITPGVIQHFIAARLAEGVSKATVNRNRACLSKMFSCAKEWGYFAGENPVALVKPFKEPAGRIRFLSAEESDRLLECAAPHVRPIILTMLHTGGRVTEVLRLRWSDVDLERGVLYFDQSNTKSGKQREVPVSPELGGVLRDRRRVRAFRGTDSEDFIFTWQGRPILRFAGAFATARKRAGLGANVTPHTCRHTFASWYMINGGDLYRLQKYLGHSTIALTQRYAHLSKDYLKAGVEFIGAPRDGARSHPVVTGELEVEAAGMVNT